MYKHFFKRIIDFCIAFVALSVLLLPLVLIALWLHFANKGAGVFSFRNVPERMARYSKSLSLKV